MDIVNSSIKAVFLLAAVLMVSLVTPTSGQMTAACTGSLINNFTPCFNFLTGSTNGGGSPTADCCMALASLISSSTDCACLIITGNVPFSMPFLGTLAISLPRMCGSMYEPLSCQGTGSPLPGPGPVTYGPSLPPLPSTRSDKPTTADASSPSPLPSPSPTAGVAGGDNK